MWPSLQVGVPFHQSVRVLRNIIQSSGILDREVGKFIRFGARHNEGSESKLHMLHLSEICEIGGFRENGRFSER
jgi:hypothetical protein